MKTRPISYKDAGVDINQGNAFVSRIRSLVNSTNTNGVIKNIGSFSSLFKIDPKKYKQPLIVSSCDGVGTKLMLAKKFGIHNTVGIDLVAMCANDVATCGARPLFFLDYIATGKIRKKVLVDIMAGIARACRETGYAIVGGETAEMPGMYKANDYDLAGFCVAIIDKKDVIDGRDIKAGDSILGLASSGLHSNGYSLVRRVLSERQQNMLKKQLLTPTRLYVKPLLSLQDEISIKGIAHITGGAYIDKIPRIIPKGLCARIRKGTWPIPAIFKIIQKSGNVEEKEMYRVFNMGIGMIAVISPKDIKAAQLILARLGVKSWAIGEIVKGRKKVELAD